MSLTKRLNRVPYGRVLFAFVVGVIIIVLLKRTGTTSTYSVKEKSYAPVAGAAPGPAPLHGGPRHRRHGRMCSWWTRRPMLRSHHYFSLH